MKESLITSGKTIESLRSDANAPAWAKAILKSDLHTWQRNEAERGLIASAHLIMGINAAIGVEMGKVRKDSVLWINAIPYSIAAIAE